jgi:hypothetical protein
MKFMYPEFLWALTVLVIPIVIHLFNFKRYKTLYFSSLNFIKHVDQQTKSTQRLKHWLILASRFLAFLFLVFAFAQPYFASNETPLSSKAPIYCFYLDNSFSMQALGPEGELLSEAREKAKEIVEKAPIDALFLIGTNEMSGREERLLNRREAIEKLDAVVLSPLTRSLNQVIFWQRNTIDEALNESPQSKVHYFLFSDFQEHGVDKFPKGKPSITYYPTQFVPEKKTNVYVDSVWFKDPTHKVGQNNTLVIQLQNDTPQDIENLEVTIQLQGVDKTIFVNAAAKKSVETAFTYKDKLPGWNYGKITVADESVFFDDSYYISYEVLEQTKVLVINGQDAVNGAHLIYELNNAYSCTTKDITALSKSDFDQKDLVIINGANDLPSGIVSYLNAFRKTGGSVAFFPGREPNLSQWNVALEANRLPLLGGVVTSGTRIQKLVDADPFYSGVFEKKTDKINLPGVNQAFRAIKRNSKSTDLILMQNGLPLLSYAKDNGAAYMLYSSAHEDFGSISKDVLFTTVLLRMAELATRSQPLALTIGQDARFPVYKEIANDNVFHIRNNALDIVPRHEEVSGVNYLMLSQLDNYTELLAGNYSIETESPVARLSLNFNREESQLNYMEPQAIEQLFGNNRFKYNAVSSSSELSTKDIDKPFSYWKLCIILTLIFVGIEMLLIRIFK